MKALPVTLQYVKILEEAQISRKQAEAHAEALNVVLTDSLATKADLKEVRSNLSQEINQVRNDLTQEINQVRNDLTQEINQVRNDLTQDIRQVRSEIAITKQELTISMGKIAAWQAFFTLSVIAIATSIIVSVHH